MNQVRVSKHFLSFFIFLNIIIQNIYRGYSNVFVKYVFYFTSEIEDIFNKKHLNFLVLSTKDLGHIPI